VLLAAAVPARAGERVVEGGTGAGAALLCLATRVASLEALVGLERDAMLAALARANAAANGFHHVRIAEAAVESDAEPGPFDHALANPPYHADRGTVSPDPARAAAKRAEPELLAAWARALTRRLRPRGTLTLALPAGQLPPALAALAAAGCGSCALLPLWPKARRPAKLVFIQAVRGGRGPCRLLVGLMLHTPDGSFTDAANAILRDGAALQM
jgi:tRNA1(Val) A37 N6-methylase TrmN6